MLQGEAKNFHNHASLPQTYSSLLYLEKKSREVLNLKTEKTVVFRYKNLTLINI